jgi:quinoprotein glucose dehydrogenase
VLALLAGAGARAGEHDGWPHWSGDAGGQRYSTLAAIGPGNVARLEVAWTWRHEDYQGAGGREVRTETAFEATPILAEGTLYLCTPLSRVVALDPETGDERWSFDPGLDVSHPYDNQATCRGVAHFRDARASAGAPCARRILSATNDARLLALDAETGRPCARFGRGGELALAPEAGPIARPGEYQVTSAPIVAGDVVVVGSAIGDNQRTDAPSGVVRGFDARTGALRWRFDPVPPGLEPSERHPRNEAGLVLGTANAWAPMSVDEARGLVFVPTGNTAPDYYGGERRGLDAYASSVLALRAASGELAWSYQTVRHDLWDFDLPAQPVLTELAREGGRAPAVLQPTKMGLLFALHRDTGEPLFPVEERPVPQRGVPGETLSPTQPFPTKPPPLSRQTLSADDVWGITPWDTGRCRRRFESLRYDGPYTPPSQEGSLMFPGNAGGSNWGGIAVDPARQLAIANVINLAWIVQLMPASEFERARRENPGVEISPMRGTPYAMRREPFLSPLSLPCTKPPWGELVAVDLAAGEIRWRRRLGSVPDVIPIPLPWLELGTPNLGGPLVTASGLVFIAAAMDDYLRAFDVETGELLWRGSLPAGGQAGPMTYLGPRSGRQFVAIAAGGHARAGTRLGGSVVAFALPD